MEKIYTVAVIGCGSRGWLYGNEMMKQPEHFRICSVCDIDETKRKNAVAQWGIARELAFESEEVFFQEKRADVLVIATQDRDHVRMGIKAMELGYDILLEKPISPFLEELQALLKANEKYKRMVVVCHVLRYAPAFLKIKEMIDGGEIGRLLHIENTEQVEYWHQAHSFVRGNWRNDQTTSSMIMQKCCHDFDLLQYFANAKCDYVYSVGGREFFHRENQPEGASDRCQSCKYINECVYSAERIYIQRWEEQGCPEFAWPFNVVCSDMPNTEDKIRKAYQANGYGQCVFACDNNVVDNQSVEIIFQNGVRATHTMSAFTGRMGRRMILHGTHGEIELLEDSGTLTLYKFGDGRYVYKISELLDDEKDEFNHGGGDAKLMRSLYEMLHSGIEASTTLEKSVESHLIAIAAEKSRKTGEVIRVHKRA